ncbi:MAG: transporter substrate-binding protein [Holophagales bacterium]|nr:transporter substrate-binding protein [Holophagales bacterium]
MSRAFRIGILHSLVGTMADSEKPLVDAARLAIEEINGCGGLLGRTLEAVVADGRSEPATFGCEARRLLATEGITTIFGCWTSTARKAVRREVEAAGGLLWYPVQYEGLEESANVFYTGGTLNQQVEPALDWALAELGNRFFLVGSDYVYPRTANRLAKALLVSHGGTVWGEALVPLGSVDFSDVIQRLQEAGPLIVFSTINGDSNVAFYRQLAAARLSPSRYPVLAMSVAETELLSIGDSAHGHLACWGYFQSLKTESNRKFIAAYRARFGSHRSTSDPIATAHTQVRLWAEAVRKAGSFEPGEVADAAVGCHLASPLGELCVRPNHHVTRSAMIGRVGADGQLCVVWASANPFEPLPWLGIERAGLINEPVIKAALAAWPEVEADARLERHRSAEALQASEQRFRAIFEAAPVGIAECDATGRYLRVNERFCEVTGFSEAELLATTVRAVTHPDDLAAELEYVRRLVAGETERCSMEKRYVRKDGSVRRVQLTFSVVRRPEGGAHTFIAIVEDLAARKLLEDEGAANRQRLDDEAGPPVLAPASLHRS